MVILYLNFCQSHVINDPISFLTFSISLSTATDADNQSDFSPQKNTGSDKIDLLSSPSEVYGNLMT